MAEANKQNGLCVARVLIAKITRITPLQESCIDYFSFKKAHYAVLQQSSLVDPYIEEHKKILLSEFPEQSEAWITREHMNTFGSWLWKHLMHNLDIDDHLFLLARGPSWNILMYQRYEINGNIF